VHGLIADGAGGAWTFGGSILTFAFPMILFIVVAGGLYVLYTKPEFVPGHRAPGLERPVSYTPIPGQPTPTSDAPASTTAPTPASTAPTPASTAEPAAASTAGTAPASTAEPASADAGETATTEDAE
jgi:cytoskeletal protein RodZ